MDTLVLGNVEIARVVELPARDRARDYVFPDVPVEHWRRHEDWLAPTFLDRSRSAARRRPVRGQGVGGVAVTPFRAGAASGRR